MVGSRERAPRGKQMQYRSLCNDELREDHYGQGRNEGKLCLYQKSSSLETSCPFEVGLAASTSGSPDLSPHHSLQVWGDGVSGTNTLMLPGCSHTSIHAHTHTPPPGKRAPHDFLCKFPTWGPPETKTSRSEPGAPGLSLDGWKNPAGIPLKPHRAPAHQSASAFHPKHSEAARSTRKPTLNSAARPQGNRPRRAAALSASRPSFRVSARTSADPRAAPGPRQCAQLAGTRGPSGAANLAGTQPECREQRGKQSSTPLPTSGSALQPAERLPEVRLWRAGWSAGAEGAWPPSAPPRPRACPERPRPASRGPSSSPLWCPSPPRPARLSFLLCRAPSPPLPLTLLAREGRGPRRRSGPLPPPGCWKLWNLEPGRAARCVPELPDPESVNTEPVTLGQQVKGAELGFQEALLAN